MCRVNKVFISPNKIPVLVTYNGRTIQYPDPLGLYAGLPLALVAMLPYVGVEFMIYETTKIAIETFMRSRSSSDKGDAKSRSITLCDTSLQIRGSFINLLIY